MRRYFDKSIAIWVVVTFFVVASCVPAKRVSFDDPFQTKKAKRVKNLEESLSAIRPVEGGSTLEKEVPEIAEAKAAVMAHPKDTARRLQLGILYHQHGFYDQASTEYHHVLNQNPEHAEVYERLGKLWLDWGSSDRAVAAVEKALALRPHFVQAYNTLGMIYDARGEFEQSQKAYQKALVIDPSLDYVQNNLCYSLARSQKYKEAAAFCREAIRLNPQNQIAYNNLGYALGMSGDLAGAYAAFVAVGDPAAAYNNIGVVLQKKQLYREAQAHFRKAWELKPDYRAAVENYAAVSAYVPSASPPAPASAAAVTAPASSDALHHVPALAEPVAFSRQAEEKLLDALTEKLRLRVLYNQPESYSFNPDFLRLSPPGSRINPVLPPDALELRPVAAQPTNSLPIHHELRAEVASIPPRPLGSTSGVDFARLLTPLPVRAAPAALVPISSVLPPATLELRPTAAVPAHARRLDSPPRAETASIQPQPSRFAPGADFIRLAAPAPASASRVAPVPIKPALPSDALELRPVAAVSMSSLRPGADWRKADRVPSAHLSQGSEPAVDFVRLASPPVSRSLPADRVPSLPASRMELRPVESLLSSALQPGSGRSGAIARAALNRPEASSLNGDFARLAVSSRNAMTTPTPLGAAPAGAVPELRPLADLPRHAPSYRGEGPGATNTDILQTHRVPQFPAVLMVLPPAERAAGNLNKTAPDTWADAASAAKADADPSSFQVALDSYRETARSQESMISRYSMSGPLDLAGPASAEGRVELASNYDHVARRRVSEWASLNPPHSQPWNTRVVGVATLDAPTAVLALPAGSAGDSDPIALAAPKATPPGALASAPGRHTTMPVSFPYRAMYDRTWLQWELGGLLSLGLLVGLAYHLLTQRARRRKALLFSERLSARPVTFIE